MELERAPLRLVYLGDLARVRDALTQFEGARLAGCVLESRDPERGEFEREGRERGYPVRVVDSRAALTDALEELAPIDAGVIANFGLILDAGQLAKARLGFVNVHLGLLPEHPGRHPIEAALAAGEKIVGVTLHEAVAKPDSGPVVCRYEVAVGESRIPEEVFERLTRSAERVVRERLPGWLANRIGR